MVSTSEVEGLGDSGTPLLQKLRDCITVCVHANVFVHNYLHCSYYKCIFIVIIIQVYFITLSL